MKFLFFLLLAYWNATFIGRSIEERKNKRAEMKMLMNDSEYEYEPNNCEMFILNLIYKIIAVLVYPLLFYYYLVDFINQQKLKPKN